MNFGSLSFLWLVGLFHSLFLRLLDIFFDNFITYIIIMLDNYNENNLMCQVKSEDKNYKLILKIGRIETTTPKILV